MQTTLPLTALGLESSKGGRDDKVPSYKVSKTRCRTFLWCFMIVAVMCVSLACVLYESAEARAALAPAWAAAVRAKRAAQHVGHFRATRLGQELERHLEHDMAEKEWALLARSRLNRLEQQWRDEVTRLAASRLEADVGLGGGGGGDGECDGVVEELREDVLGASDAMWSELRQTLSLLDSLVARGESAEAQHDSVQREILEELRRDSEERDLFAAGVASSAAQQQVAYQELDDAARQELMDADAWRRDLVDRFLQNYDRFAETNAKFTLPSPSPTLDKLEALYAALEGAADAAEGPPTVTWRAAEETLAGLKDVLDGYGAPAYEPNKPVNDDDALDYVQIHNVLAYLSDLKWRAKLSAARVQLDASREQYNRRTLTPMAFVEQLEEMEGRGAFPSDWLYSSGIDDLEFAD